MAPNFIDLSHTIEHGMITYRGLPAPLICDFLSREASRAHYAPGTEFHIGRIDMVANTGTYLDSPFHRFPDGADLADLPLESLAGLDAVVVRSERGSITREAFNGIDVRGKAVLVHTDWSRHWRTDTYFEGHPFLAEDAALHLKQEGAKLVGIDSYNIDDTRDGRRPVHTILLGAQIPIVEHMTGLAPLPDSGFQFYAVPPKVRAFGTFPVRCFAQWQKQNSPALQTAVAGDCSLRPMNVEDLPVVRALWESCEGVGLSPGDELSSLATILQRNAGLSSVVLSAAGEIVGAAVVGHDARRGYLYHLAVKQSHRGKGLGRALVDRSLAGLRAAGIQRCTIVVLAGNERGAEFWRHLGWSAREDLRVMQTVP